jgi:hypothetical protein
MSTMGEMRMRIKDEKVKQGEGGVRLRMGKLG